jgi:hypothetical protein
LTRVGCCLKNLFPNIFKRFEKLSNIGKKKIADEMNIGRIVKELRKLKIVNNNILMNPMLEFEIKNQNENIIDIDSESQIIQIDNVL